MLAKLTDKLKNAWNKVSSKFSNGYIFSHTFERPKQIPYGYIERTFLRDYVENGVFVGADYSDRVVPGVFNTKTSEWLEAIPVNGQKDAYALYQCITIEPNGSGLILRGQDLIDNYGNQSPQPVRQAAAQSRHTYQQICDLSMNPKKTQVKGVFTRALVLERIKTFEAQQVKEATLAARQKNKRYIKTAL